MATAERAFKGASPMSVISSILRDEPPLVSDVRPIHPAALARIIRRCLEKDPSRRYQATTDLRKDLADRGPSARNPTVTPDGRSIVFEGRDESGDRIWRMDVDGGSAAPISPGPLRLGSGGDARWTLGVLHVSAPGRAAQKVGQTPLGK
jgi:serine/threonine protein kinase